MVIRVHALHRHGGELVVVDLVRLQRLVEGRLVDEDLIRRLGHEAGSHVYHDAVLGVLAARARGRLVRGRPRHRGRAARGRRGPLGAPVAEATDSARYSTQDLVLPVIFKEDLEGTWASIVT